NPGWALAVDSATFIVSGILRAQMRIARTDRPPRTHLLTDIREGWGEFRSRTWVWVMVASFGFFQLTLFPALLVLGPVVAKAHLGGPGAWAAILSSQGIGSLAGGAIALRYHARRPIVAATLFCVPMGLVLLLLGVAAPVLLP